MLGGAWFGLVQFQHGSQDTNFPTLQLNIKFKHISKNKIKIKNIQYSNRILSHIWSELLSLTISSLVTVYIFMKVKTWPSLFLKSYHWNPEETNLAWHKTWICLTTHRQQHDSGVTPAHGADWLIVSPQWCSLDHFVLGNRNCYYISQCLTLQNLSIKIQRSGSRQAK